MELQVYGVEDGIQSEATRKLYKVFFDNFLDYIKIDGSTLLNRVYDNPRLVEDMIIGYVRFLSTKQGRGSINNILSAIFHFFEINDVLLNKRKIKRFLPADQRASERDRYYTYEEIQQILHNCDERTRVMVLLMASTGMRIGALPDLTLADLTEIPDYSLYKIMVYSKYPKDRYYTFCTPECKQAIDSYLDYRRRFGDPLKDRSPLIREQFDIYDRIQALSPKPVKYAGIVWLMGELLKRSGIKSNDVMSSHGLRKFAISQMIKAKVDYGTREYVVGHKHSRGLDVSYDRTTEEDRLEEYLKAVDLLTINPESRLRRQVENLQIDTEKFAKLETEIRKLRELVEG